jgi:hypothetical protein
MVIVGSAWHRVPMTEYRAFDNKGAVVGSQDLSDTDSAVAWGISVAVKGAVLVERKSGDEWICFEEFRAGRHDSNGAAG